MMNKYEIQQDSIPTESIQWGSSWPGLAEESERIRLLSYLEERFGIKQSDFNGCLFFKKKKGWWIFKNSKHISSAVRLKSVTLGLRAFHNIGSFIKPSTRLIQIYGHLADKNVQEVEMNEFSNLLNGEEIPCKTPMENGYVIILVKGQAIGLGLVINGLIRSQISKKALNYLRS